MEIREGLVKKEDAKVLGSAQYYVAYEGPRNNFKESLKGEPKEVELDELRDYRMSLGLTQKGVSKLANVSQSTLSAIERGEGEPNRTTLEKIEKALNIKLVKGVKKYWLDEQKEKKKRPTKRVVSTEVQKEFIDLIQELAIIDDNLELYRQKLALVENEIEALVTDREAIEKELESYKVMKVGEVK